MAIITDEDYYIEIESFKAKSKEKIQNVFKKFCEDKYGSNYIPTEDKKILFINTYYSELLKDIKIEELI